MTDAVWITLHELVGVQAHNTEEDKILDKLKELAKEALPEGWEGRRSLHLPAQTVLGIAEDETAVEPQVLNKLRFALPTVGIARAFNSGVGGLSERKFRDIKVRMLKFDFYRALIISPPVLVDRVQGSAEKAKEFLQFIKPMKQLFISRSEVDQMLKEEAESDSGDESETEEDSETDNEDDPPPKRSRVEELEDRMMGMFQTLVDKMDRKDHVESNKENSAMKGERGYGEDLWRAPATGWNPGQAGAPGMNERDLVLVPQVKVCEPPIQEPEPKIRAEGMACQKLGTFGLESNKIQRGPKETPSSTSIRYPKGEHPAGSYGPEIIRLHYAREVRLANGHHHARTIDTER